MDARFVALSLVAVPAVFSLSSVQRAPAQAPPTRVAYISAQRVVAGSAEAREAVVRAQSRRRETAVDFRAKQRDLEAVRRELAAAQDAKKRAELEKKVEEQQAELAREASEAQSQLQDAQRQLHTELLGLLNPILKDLAAERKVDVVLNADLSVVWAAEGLDLTSEVVQRLNARAAGVGDR